jgi:hypothetical protein
MKDFNYWKKLLEKQELDEFSSDRVGLLWLKIKSITRKGIIDDVIATHSIPITDTALGDKFTALYSYLLNDVEQSHLLLDGFIRLKSLAQASELNTSELVSELYKLRVFDWGGDYQNSLDKYLVSRYVKAEKSYDKLISKFETEINVAVRGYVLNSWYNHWSSVLIEHIFKADPSVLPTVGQIKGVDFFIGDIPFDLKVTYLPAEYIKSKRKELGLPVELTFLKEQARVAKIDFLKDADPSSIYYEITQKMRDKGCPVSVDTLAKVRKEYLQILSDARANPKTLSKWLYENQGEMRFGSENRIFLVLVDTEDFDGSWKLKRNIELLKPTILQYLSDFQNKSRSDLEITFNFKGKPGPFNTLADIIFVIK